MADIYKEKNILVFGLGVNQGGVGAARFFAKMGREIKITDLKTKIELRDSLDQLRDFKNITYTLGEHKNEDIDWADLIIKNPAIKPGNRYLYYAQKKKKTIETDMGIFFQLVKPGQIIGITGTKGKSTTASLIFEALKSKLHTGCGNVVFAGNIGKSVLDTLEFIDPQTLVVLEISSFQMEGLVKHKISPKYAVITNIYQDHLNYHPNMPSYKEAKRMIAFYQKEGDFLFLNRDNELLNNPFFLENLKAKITFFSKDDLLEDFKPTLPGSHNLSNYAAALAVANALGIPQTKALKAMNKFKGAQFRLQTIKTWKGFKIVNDSTATNPSATIEALRTFGENIILICGGMNKNMDYHDLSYAIDLHTKAVYFLEGDVVDTIIENVGKKPILKGRFDNLEKLLLQVKKDITSNPYYKKGDVILFSPAATSFNLFQNEFDRGRKFNDAAERIFR